MNPKVTVNREKEKSRYISNAGKWPQIAKKRKKDTLPDFQSDCKSEKGEKQIQIRRQEVTVNREK